MISVADALTLISAGVVIACVCIFFGAVLRSAWMSRKLAPKKPIVVQQQGGKAP